MLKKNIFLTLLILGVASGTLFSETQGHVQQNTIPGEIQVFKADQYIQLADYAMAFKIYLSLIKSRPNDALLNNKAGYACYKMLQYREALPFLSKAIFLESTNAAFWNNKAICHFKTGEGKAAESAYLEAIRLNPANPKYSYNLAVLYFYQRAYKKSFAQLLKSYRLNKKYVHERVDKKKYLAEIRIMREKYPDDAELIQIEKRLGGLNK